MAHTNYRRIVYPTYDDGKGSPRTRNLPSPLTISDSCFQSEVSDPIHNSFLMTFGQFVVHDMALSIKKKGSTEHFDVPDSVKPMPFVRSTDQCQGFRREQGNKITAFIDGNLIYGDSKQRASDLRLHRYGLLKNEPSDFTMAFNTFYGLVTHRPVSELMPRDPGNKYNFKSGDGRAGETSMLTSLHTLFKNEHNRIAKQIKASGKISPNEDELIYQEAKRIVTAELQHIFYDEYLPMIVGPDYMNAFELWTTRDSPYNPGLNPSIFNAFVFAYRFGHSQIPPSVMNKTIPQLTFNPLTILTAADYEGFLKAEMSTYGSKVDLGITHDFRRNLPEMLADKGFDLAAINIQRSRDHGIGSYMDY